MNRLGMFCIVSMLGWLGGLPVAAHDCSHCNQHYADCGDCRDCGHHGYASPQSRRGPADPAPTGEAANLQAVAGRIVEIVYLPGASPDSGMVEIRVQAAGPAKLVRLGPAGFLKQGGLRVREGDAVTVKGFPVAAMEGDLLVATEVHTNDVTLSLRDALGRPAW